MQQDTCSGKIANTKASQAGGKMLYWAIYDISSNSKRSKVASKCKNYGMKRVQKSAFLGQLTKNKAEMLAIEIGDTVKDETDAVFIIPACIQCYNSRQTIGSFDESAAEQLQYAILGEDKKWTKSSS